MTIVIENFFPRAFVNHRLVALEARSLFALAGRHSDGAEFDSFDRPIRLRFPAVETDAVEARIFEGNTFVTGERLRSQIETSRTILDLGGNYDPEKVDSDERHLEEYYKNFGYQDARVRRRPQAAVR